MKKIICLAAALLLLALALTGCHKHVSAAPATCTEPEICTECGKLMTEALGHDPGPEATCAAPQTCRRCGIELSPQLPTLLPALPPARRPRSVRYAARSSALRWVTR